MTNDQAWNKLLRDVREGIWERRGRPMAEKVSATTPPRRDPQTPRDDWSMSAAEFINHGSDNDAHNNI